MITAEELINKYIELMSPNCEHEVYCKRKECNRLGYTLCHVDLDIAKGAALICIEQNIAALNNPPNVLALKKVIKHYKDIAKEIEEL